MQTIVYQYDTAMPAQKLPNCCDNVNMCINSYGKHAVGHACRNHKVCVYDVLLFSR